MAIHSTKFWKPGRAIIRNSEPSNPHFCPQLIKSTPDIAHYFDPFSTMAAVASRRGPTPGSKASSKIPTFPPNQTLYITNLPSSKIQKSDLRISLYTLFSTYGPVLDVVALRTAKMRGQAHVVFRDIETATQAMRATQGMEFFGKEMVCI
jgi:RNA recognition motif-containing protein